MNVQADILKVGHHGSRTASGQAFIDAVKPEVSSVSVGAGNTYGLPDEDALARIQAVSKPYRTDSDGPVVVTTDGSTYTVTTQKTGYEETGTASSHSESNASNSASSTATEEPNTASLSPGSAESTVYLSDNKNDGWKIGDEGSKNSYTFPSYTLNSGSTVTVYTGKGASTTAQLYWGSASPIWNNGGDAAYLYDKSGKLVFELKR